MWSGHVVWYLYKECGSHTREAAKEEFDSIWNRFRLCCHPASEKKESYHLSILKLKNIDQIKECGNGPMFALAMISCICGFRGALLDHIYCTWLYGRDMQQYRHVFPFYSSHFICSKLLQISVSSSPWQHFVLHQLGSWGGGGGYRMIYETSQLCLQ